MGKPNYSVKKRQKELARLEKREQKKKRKLERIEEKRENSPDRSLEGEGEPSAVNEVPEDNS